MTVPSAPPRARSLMADAADGSARGRDGASLAPTAPASVVFPHRCHTPAEAVKLYRATSPFAVVDHPLPLPSRSRYLSLPVPDQPCRHDGFVSCYATAAFPPPPPTTLTTYPWSVTLVAALYATASFALVRSLVTALRTEPLFPDAFATVAASPWTLATLADFGVGVLAAAAYIAVREAYEDAAVAATAAAFDEGLLGADATPPRRGALSWTTRAAAWTAAICCLGNPVVCVYAVTTMVARRGVSAGLLPAADAGARVVSDGGGRDEAPPSSARRTWPIWVLVAATVVGVAFVAICLWAGIVEGSAGWTYLLSHPWATATFLDNAVGLTVSGTYLWVRERGSGGWRRGAWMGALLAGGNAAIAAYVATLAMEGLREKTGPAAIVLGRRRRTE
ncbi:hypothetical protein MMPV_008806 [Pyropia vietnamensis]